MGLYCISIYSFWSAYYIRIHNDNKLVEVRYSASVFLVYITLLFAQGRAIILAPTLEPVGSAL